MLLTVEGIYSDGKVELTETPTGVHYAKVLGAFLPQAEPPGSARYLRYGQFGECMSTESVFSARQSLSRPRSCGGHSWALVPETKGESRA